MSAALSIGRVGGLAVALGVGAALLYGSAVASAEESSEEPPVRPVAVAAATAPNSTASLARVSGRSAPASARVASASGPAWAAGPARAAGPTWAAGPARAAALSGAGAAPADRGAIGGLASTRASTDLLQANAITAAASPAPPSRTAAALAGSTPAVTVPAVEAVGVSEPVGSILPAVAGEQTATVAPAPSVGPDPLATVSTDYGELGKWMLRNGKIANWIDLPLCDPSGDCKTIQEPINMVFVVEASSRWGAQLRLDHSLRKAKFGPSPFSSIGYSGIVDGVLSGQMPHGGIFGFGLIPPLPFDLGSGPGLIPLLAPLGLGAAYRDAPFWEANAHLRTFGGTTDGDGKYIFTASVSDEYLISTGGLLPTHAYESFVDARAALAADMLAIGATDLGMIDMQNEISPLDPDYTTGDHDGYAMVIGIAPRTVAPNPIRRKERGAAVRNPVSV